jgi:site-specific DNA-methyltransferase (adenine-specific)
MRDVWVIASTPKREKLLGGHPTQKPLSLIKDLIVKHSNVEETVLDTFAGSGTTAIASIETGRNYICIERDENYFKLALQRIETYNSVSNKLLNFI